MVSASNEDRLKSESCNLSSPYAYMSDGSGMTGFSALVHSADLMSGNLFGKLKAK